jgi:hypothetical protein
MQRVVWPWGMAGADTEIACARESRIGSAHLQYPKDLVAVERKRGVGGCWFVEWEVRQHDDPVATLARPDDLLAQPVALALAAPAVEGHIAPLGACGDEVHSFGESFSSSRAPQRCGCPRA